MSTMQMLISNLSLFLEFLEIKDKKERGDFVDLDKLECTPKVYQRLWQSTCTDILT